MSVIYKKSIKTIGKFVPEKFQPLWNHPAGPQTIFFWAPAFKWGLVIAGLGDLHRPANQLSISQSLALGITGLIWTRYSLAIKPKNWSLCTVNVVVALTSMYQVGRAIKYLREQEALQTAMAAEAKQ